MMLEFEKSIIKPIAASHEFSYFFKLENGERKYGGKIKFMNYILLKNFAFYISC